MEHKSLLARVIGMVTLFALLVACGPRQAPTTALTPTATPEPVPATIGPAYWPTDGWQVSTPEAQGLDSAHLADLLDFIQEQEYDIHSVTIVRHGYLVLDAPLYPFAPGEKHNLHSCTKSITSALVGIAIEQGYIASVEQPVLSFFPGRTFANLDASKAEMTLEDLLTMASGLECRDSGLYNWQGLDQMLLSDDWVQFMLDLPMMEPPGTRFEYCNGASFLLSAIIQETTGMNAAAFAEAHLFGPLGITDVIWPANPQGITLGWGELRMRPQDMAKIGYLYLHEGQWAGRQIVPADWVATSTKGQIAATYTPEYGYQWWVAGDGSYAAMGLAGQFIFVAPELDMVVVFTSNFPAEDVTIPYGLFYDFIIPAVKEPLAMASNPDGVQHLESRVQQIALARTAPEPVPPLPQTAERISGKRYTLDPNLGGLLSVTLTFPGESEALFSWSTAGESAEQVGWTADVDLDRVYQSNSPAGIQADWPVGLDNVYRFTPGPFELPMALKGRWESADTFVIYADYIGNTGKSEFRFTFTGDDLNLQIRNLQPVPGFESIMGRLAD
jgi:CubicO group peptidase (beta-lactamase class C family)